MIFGPLEQAAMSVIRQGRRSLVEVLPLIRRVGGPADSEKRTLLSNALAKVVQSGSSAKGSTST